ncbi:MAG TPA: glycosyltransferase family 9 protein [Pyrinomonadaceae bacterium]|jgi:lipopolysaccharide heptosyltransferase II|nr:glycosyltransferase family 9 protein [Pyrinomonadaceae bacterium]
MKSLRENPEPIRPYAFASTVSDARAGAEDPQPLGPARWDWGEVRRVLVVRLRSIGDTVLATPALHALRRFVPHARIDVLLEDWVAPVLDGFPDADTVIALERGSAVGRARVAREVRAARYDVAFNLHGGTTATLLTRASGARHRVGYADYQYSRLHNHAAPSPLELWGSANLHSVEQQLALLGWTGVPVSDRPPTHLAITEAAAASIEAKLRAQGLDRSIPLALLHPAAAFETKQWATSHFARVAEYLHGRKLYCVAVAAPSEAGVVAELLRASAAPIKAFTDLSLPEVTALAARSRLFVGNDSGIAHIAAAVRTPSVVVFGSSNITHWRPWASAPAATVREELPCQPCPGYTCAEFDHPECIRRVSVERVTAAVERLLEESNEPRAVGPFPTERAGL